MTLTRLVLVLLAGLLTTDYKFGDGRLIQSVSAQTVELGHRLNYFFSRVVTRIAP